MIELKIKVEPKDEVIAIELQNVAGSDVLTLRRIAEIIGEMVGKKPHFTNQPTNTIADLIGDIARMKSLLCEPEVGFNDGVSAYLKSLLD